jgi:hypothetical protein
MHEMRVFMTDKRVNLFQFEIFLDWGTKELVRYLCWRYRTQ